MFTSLEITNFRAFQSLKIDGLRRVNIFGGKNSVGKTCVLEACELLLAPESLRPAHQNIRRGLMVLPSIATGDKPAVDLPWNLLFHNSKNETPARIEGSWGGRQLKTELGIRFPLNESNQTVLLARQSPAVVLSLQQWNQAGRILRIKSTLAADSAEALVYPAADGSWNWSYNLPPYSLVVCNWTQSQDASSLLSPEDQFGIVLSEGREATLVSCLKNLLPDLQQLITISKNNRPVLHAAFGDGRRLPVSILGDGVVRVLHILLAGLAQPGGAWLIDEIEFGIHYSVLPEVWSTIIETAKTMNKQIFCTTHSQEMVTAALNAGGDDVQYFRIDARKDGHHVVAYERDVAEMTLKMGMDFR